MDDDDTARAARARRGSPYLNTDQAAYFLKLSRRTLQRMRGKGIGPIPRRHARMVLYHIDDLEAWSRDRADALAREVQP
ncbi:helix-turn-helix domain-containing protein [Sphingomonas sp.]|uniref:helix-turn-helix domain-containing protein n=1 Tax=Sphingomonas sp. TaxID=28214 RepID=UPI000DB169D5|nr:helix-turn-helix domain-containing protein [Sphingomonas sp.]PZU06702.1 MAG: DNA-binding protein [Sphingomonas sp.]